MFFIFSCQKDDDISLPIEDSMNGFWLVADKGYIFEFTDGSDIFYNINAAGCTIQEDDFTQSTLVSDGWRSQLTTPALHHQACYLTY